MTQKRRDVPARALVLSVLSLAVPVAGSIFFHEWATDEYGLLMWMTALVPAFLLTYYRGWQGASVALALGMAALSVSQVGAMVAGLEAPAWDFLPVIVILYIAFCFGIGVLAELLLRERRAAEQMALTDPLTGLPNRRHANVFIGVAAAAATRGTPLSVVLFDLDRFKNVNDSYGHEAGDSVLQAFAKVLTDQTRRSNLSTRWGGEEFLCILSDCDRHGALAFAERVRADLAALDHYAGPITASAGVAVYDEGMGSADVLVAAADQALYLAKEGGRNRSVVAGEEGRQDSATPTTKRPRTGGSSAAPTQARILLVDDDPAVLETLARMLSRLGHEVLEAEDAQSALKIAEDEGAWIDLVMTDVILPDLNGFALVERLARIRTGLPVVYVSGELHGEVSWAGVPGRVTAFLEKPVEMEVLEATLGKVLGAADGLAGETPLTETLSTPTASV